MSDIEIKTAASPVENTLVPAHIPSAGQLIEMRARGLGVEEIATQIRQSVTTTRAILTAAERSHTMQAARDIIVRDLVPLIVDNISAGLHRGAASKRDLEVATFSLNLADRIGLTNLSVAPAETSTKTETLEEFILRRTTKHESTAAAKGSGNGSVVTTTSVNLPDGNAPDNACIDAEVIRDDAQAALPESIAP
jgi:orotate phosphoribosyltransferase-like protein